MEATNLSLLETLNKRTWTKAAAHFSSPNLETPEAMTVFEFDDFRTYLVYVRDHYPGMRRPITLERWAKKLNYRSPRSIAMVLKGQRLPSEDLVVAFSIDLKHTENERRYFELLVRKEKHKDNLPAALKEELSKLNPRQIKRKPLEAELFSYVADWHHYVILQLMTVENLEAAHPDEEAARIIAERLGGRLNGEEAKLSLLLLERLKLLERAPDSGFLRIASKDPLIATDEVPSAAGRKHHFEQMDQAKEALVRQPLAEREFSCLTLRGNRKDIPAMKKAVKEFRDHFAKEFGLDPGEDVCQLNVQFFLHTAEKK
jgi:uncharacterized protein (TIGR02147 family)